MDILEEICLQSYEQIINGVDIVEVEVKDYSKKITFNLCENSTKINFINSMIQYYVKKEEYEKCNILTKIIKK